MPELKKIEQDTFTFGDPKALDTLERSENAYQTCIVLNMEWTPGEAESILLEPTSWVFPGNVLDAKSLQNGKYTTIAGDRKSINLVINGQIFNKMSINVPSPSEKSIKDSIKSMITSGKIGSQPSDIVINAHEVFSEDHLKLLVRSNYNASFGSLAAGFDFNNNQISSRYLLDVTQIYYTINMEVPTAGIFNYKPESITDSTAAPVYISSIKYGRRVMIAVETQESDQKTEADFRAKFNAIASSGKLDVNIFSDKFFNDKSVKLMVKGGNASNTYALFKAVSNKQELFDILANDAEWSLNNLGIPLAYEVRNTSDNSVFYISQTGKYKARKCTVKSQKDTTVNINPLGRLCFWWVGGSDRNFGGNPSVNFTIKLVPDKNIINCNINGFVSEGGGNQTVGYYNTDVKIVELPQDYTITQITTPSNITQPSIQLSNQGPNPFRFDAAISPVSLVTVIGDSPDNHDDDLYPGPCVDDIHAQLHSISFYPISFEYTRNSFKEKK